MKMTLNNKLFYFLVFDIMLLFLFSSFNLTNAQKMDKAPIKVGINFWVPNFFSFLLHKKKAFLKKMA